VLIFDDTVQEKAHSQENNLTCWHFDHTINHSVKGINLLNCLYHANDVSLPVAFEIVTKPIRFCDVNTRKEKRKSVTTKNELLRGMLSTCRQNQLKWRYILADSWFSSTENMQFIHEHLKKYFILALKSNRLVALSLADKQQGRYACFNGVLVVFSFNNGNRDIGFVVKNIICAFTFATAYEASFDTDTAISK